ncbi:glycosyltransferase family protein [Mucilaginibacter sp.]
MRKLNVYAIICMALMRKILIVNSSLALGGAEKLIYELAIFSKKNDIKPTILILDSYQAEYYDEVFKQKKIKVVRTRLQNIKHLRAPLKMFRSIYWSIILKYFANNIFNSIHIIGLYNVYKIKKVVTHRHRFFWHVTNAIQNPNYSYAFDTNYFNNEQDTVVCINAYQVRELKQQYGDSLLSKITLFRLFFND